MIAAAFSSASAATIVYDFDDNDGVVDTNDFGLGVTAGDFAVPTGAGGGAIQNLRAEGGVRNDGSVVMSFAVTIPSTTTVDLAQLTFDAGFNQTFSAGNAITDPTWTLTIDNGGTGIPTSGISTDIPAGNVEHVEDSFVVSLSGLTGLSDTTVNFSFAFTTNPQLNNSLARAHTLDNVVLTGTSAAVPEPSSATLLGLGGLALILRRRK